MSDVYETHRNVLASKVNKKLDTTTVSSYFYTVNNYGQRTNVTTDGTAFAGSPSWAWGYNAKGEVVKADHSADTNFSRAYAYDGIGNRISGGGLNPPSQTSYTANSLNQYTAIGSLTPVHDDDGNMTSGPLPANVNANSNLTWDGENRLIEAQVNSGQTVNFIYDSQSRRIAETVGSNTTVYIYDGWNPIAEYSIQSSQFTLHSSFTWGIDLSGSIQGAGGVGGLLMVTVGSAGSADRYFPTFDGNGNVSEYLDATGATVAHYEYDPFGKTTVAMGSKANDFAHRFSTKPLDLTTGLYYYGYRYYDPNTGRWPSRDPIEEDGGMNLYNFVGNHSANAIDILGREEMAVAAGAAVAIGGGTPWLTSALFTPAAAIVGVVGIVVLTPMTIDAVGEAIESTAAENSIREQGVELQRTLDARRRALEQERAQEAACTKDPVICWVVRSYVQGPGWRCDIECSNGLKFAVPCGAQAPGTTYPWPGAPPNEEEGEEWPPL